MARCGWGIALLVSFTVASACGGRAATDPNSTGSAGAPGAPDAVCSLPQQAGSCLGSQPSFWHNPKSGLCEPFTYGGCGGNANRFATQAECVAACPGGGGEWGACQRDSDCVVVAPGCCVPCEPLGAERLYAVSSKHAAEERAAMCPEIPPCVPCPNSRLPEATSKYFIARCDVGQCTVVDIRTTPITECSSGADCTLRVGTECCPGCNQDFIGVNRAIDFCPDGPERCGLCVAIEPAGLGLDCIAGRCTVTLD